MVCGFLLGETHLSYGKNLEKPVKSGNFPLTVQVLKGLKTSEDGREMTKKICLSQGLSRGRKEREKKENKGPGQMPWLGGIL